MGVRKIETLDDFTQMLIEAGDKLVVVDFYADWCGPCKMISPKVEAMSNDFSDVVFVKVDVDENDETSEKYGIQAMPTFMFFKNGQKMDSFAGANEARLREFVERFKK